METKLKKKYGLFTAICMVVGIVIGSGVFFKAEKVLLATGGDLKIGILSWIIGGLIMINCAYTFSLLANRYENVNGIVDYAEEIVGRKFGYIVGWFMTIIYYPSLTSVISWVCARYTMVLFGHQDVTSGLTMSLSVFYLILSFTVNILSPRLAGVFQVSTTFIKLIPIFSMAIIGTIVGLSNGLLIENFTKIPSILEITKVRPEYVPSIRPLLTAVVATSFAYDGWIISTSINSELENSKKNLPIALVVGSIIVVATYVFYYVGLSGAVENLKLIESAQDGVKLAYSNIFSNIGGTLLFVFILISCLGTLFGITLGCTRSLFSLSIRNLGPKPKLFSSIERETDMPINSAIFSMLITGFWLFYFYGANLTTSIFGKFTFDPSELPIVTLYGLYIVIFIRMIFKETNLSIINRVIIPVFSIFASIFMIYATFVSHGLETVSYYLLLFLLIQLIGKFFYKKRTT